MFSTLQSRWSNLWRKQQQPAYSVTESDLQEVEQSESEFTDASSVLADDLYNDDIESSSNVASAASADVAADVAEDAVVKGLVSDIGGDIRGAIVGIAVEALFSAIFPSDPNAEVMTALANLSNQITNLQSSVNQLQAYVASAFAQSEYYTNAEQLRGAFSTIDTAWNGPDSNNEGYAAAQSQAGQNPHKAATALASILPGGQNYQSIATLSSAQSQIASAQ
ncbi:MAG: hypothetical protein EB084_24420, partial [Proteobacteria bacterium]|nr:hypothetical protein [Pseudomonadota bacterium]